MMPLLLLQHLGGNKSIAATSDIRLRQVPHSLHGQLAQQRFIKFKFTIVLLESCVIYCMDFIYLFFLSVFWHHPQRYSCSSVFQYFHLCTLHDGIRNMTGVSIEPSVMPLLTSLQDKYFPLNIVLVFLSFKGLASIAVGSPGYFLCNQVSIYTG